jgi:hypothetical protein
MLNYTNKIKFTWTLTYMNKQQHITVTSLTPFYMYSMSSSLPDALGCNAMDDVFILTTLHRATNLLNYIHKQCLVLTHLFSHWELELSTCTVSTGGVLFALTPTPPSNPGNGGKAVASRSNCIPFEEIVPVLSLFRGRGLPPEVDFPLPIIDDDLPGPITSSSFLLRRCLQSQ